MKENHRCGLVANAQHFAAVRSQRGGKIAVQLPHALSAQRAHARDNGLRVIPSAGGRVRGPYLLAFARVVPVGKMARNALWV